jgi:hypothetical protein
MHQERSRALALTLALATYNAFAQLPVRTEDHRLEPRGQQLEIYDWYGWNVDIYRDRAAIASKNDSTLASATGCVLIYLRRSSGWELLQKLLPSDFVSVQNPPWSTSLNYFGQGMAMDQDWLFVGAPVHDLPGTNDGAVYSYRWNGSRYEFFQKIQAPDLGLYGNFGSSIAFRGGDLFIGKPGDDVGGSFYGAVYVFRWNGTAWTFLSKETNYEHDFRNFGDTLALDANLLVVGSVHRVSIMQVGPSGLMTRLQYLVPPYGPADFGRSVALEGDVLVVGHPREYYFEGQAWVYRRVGGTFIQEQILFGDGLIPHPYGTSFGRDVALRDGLIVVGAPAAYDPAIAQIVGRAFVFEHSGAGWNMRERLEVDRQGVNYHPSFGGAVALHDGTILVGASGVQVHGMVEVGAGLVFELPLGSQVCAGNPTSTGSPATLRVLGVPAVGANAISLKASELPGAGLAVFLAGQATAAPLFIGSGLLCIGGAQRLGVSPVSGASASEFAVNLPSVGTSGVQPGDSVTFQAWFRDADPAPTSNLTSAVEVTFY